jgi:hypothetical protein
MCDDGSKDIKCPDCPFTGTFTEVNIHARREAPGGLWECPGYSTPCRNCFKSRRFSRKGPDYIEDCKCEARMRFEQAKINFGKWCEEGLERLYQKQVIEGGGDEMTTGQDLLNQAAFCLENTMLSASGMFNVAGMISSMVSRLPVPDKKKIAGQLAAELPLPVLSLSSLSPLPPSALLQLSNNNNNNSSSSSAAASSSESEKQPPAYVPETQQPGSLYNQPPSMSQQQPQEPTPMETQETILLQDKDNTLSTAPATYDSFTKEDDTQAVLEKIMNPLLKISLTNSSQETKTIDLTAAAPSVGQIPLQAAKNYAKFSLNVRKGNGGKTSLSSTTTVVQSTTVTETSSSSSSSSTTGQVPKKVKKPKNKNKLTLGDDDD